MTRPCIFNRRLRLSLLQRPSSESPHHYNNRHICAFAINRRISAFPRAYYYSSPHSRSILHSQCRALLLSLSSSSSSLTATHRSRYSTSTMETKALPTIQLTPVEESLRTLFVDVAASIDSEKAAQSSSSTPPEPTVLRITGGWVRDKLLGGKSHDIDIGINNMTGFEFASRLTEFLENTDKDYHATAKSVHKIESNPDKSKHLETATTNLMGLDIDFVNLRSESYSEESRVPKMEFGTPKEDALRRDACVNALFYNLMTREIEDFTERGLSDLENRIIRTPLPPVQTFKDDPLRVLRLIRFASRLSFTIDPEAEEAMKDPAIKAALKKKISRERVGVEMEKMLYGERPYDSLDLVERLGLGDAIFEVPDLEKVGIEKGDVVPGHFRKAIDTLKWFFGEFQDLEGYSGVKKLLVTKRDEYLLWIFTAILPWASVYIREGRQKVIANVGAIAARDGLKMSNKDYESLKRMTMEFNNMKFTMSNISSFSRSDLGGFIRKLGAEWRIQVLAGLLVELAEAGSVGSSSEIIKPYEEFLKRVYDDGVEDAWDLKPLLTVSYCSRETYPLVYEVKGKKKEVTLTRHFLSTTGRRFDRSIEATSWEMAEAGVRRNYGVAVG
ncbi:CCA tRNA nucleotidyltransferase, mitochondrial, variant 2 [Orbilia javanica]|uniref:CCA tRNA nucleotidyltransferase, mitochondrial, variant 2 n=1 Tax=Orbilia javanica TaxID=47235 RepID=A0AAN8MZZ4_9PEZI